MPFFDQQYMTIWLPMVASIVAGAAIGFERELKSKAAGVRTHALVCFSAAILMMAASRQGDWVFDPIAGTAIVADPTRMAHGILTGIGFLGAGVIFRQGGSVRGLTTAASIWMTASLGVLYGAGLTKLAIAGTATALIVLVIFRLFHMLVPDRIEFMVEVRGKAAVDPAGAMALLRHHAARVGQMGWRRGPDGTGGEQIRICTRIWLRDQSDAETLDLALREMEGVQSFSLAPVVEAERLGW